MKILKRVEISKKFTLINLIILIISTPILLITIHFLQNNQQKLTSFVPKNTQTNFFIYNDALANSWHNGSSTDSVINLSATAQAYSGSCAISFTANKAFAGMYLYTDTTLDTSSYTSLQFALRASQPRQQYTVALYDRNEQPLTSPLLLAKYGGDPDVGKWKIYTIPLEDLKAQKKQVKALLLQSQSSHAQPAVYVDAIQLMDMGITPSLTVKTLSTPIPTLTPTATSTPTLAASWKSHVMAWVYPGSSTCNASDEYKDGRVIDTLKPQYYTLNTSGKLIQLTTATNGCNAYSLENAVEIKQYSKHQYVTISGSTTSINALVTSQAKMAQAITTLKTFLDTVKFTGVEIDFEGFAQWTPQQYNGYKNFLSQLGNILHQNGYKLMIDGPAIVADNSSQYQWQYEDFNTLPVDYIVIMEYDWQYDFGVGTPVAPLAREYDITKEIIGKITDINKIVIGIPSYGYHGQIGGNAITIDTNAQSQTYPGYNTAKRDDSSAEMMFTSAGVFYDYADSQTLNTKRSLIENLGIKNISVWHLGGNQWFSGKSEPQCLPHAT